MCHEQPSGGWQYTIYYLQDKVIKYPKSSVEIARAIVRDRPFRLLRLWDVPLKVRRLKRLRKQSIDELKQRPINYSLLANLELDGRLLIQDRVTPIKDAYMNGDRKRRRLIIDRWIDCLLACWREGFCEGTYHFMENYGIVDDEVVVIDVGELCFSKSQIEADIRGLWWLDSSWTSLLPDDRAYLRSEMTRRLTVEKLNETWNNNHRDAPSFADSTGVEGDAD